MKFSVDQKVFEKFPDYLVGVIVAQDIDNTKGQNKILELLNEEVSDVQKRLKKTPVDQLPHVKAWRNAFRKAGTSPDKFPPSAEALVDRVSKGQKPPNINPIINLINAVAIKYNISIGGHDLDRTRGDIQVRPSNTGDTFRAMNSQKTEEIKNEIVYADGEEILTRKWIWRQGEKSKTDSDTRNIFIPLDALPPITEPKLFKITEELRALITSYLGGEATIFIVSKSNPVVTLPTLTKRVGRKTRDKLEEVLARGVKEVLPSKEGLARLMGKRRIRLYNGIDPTGGELHLGHSLVLRKLQQFVELGHEVILLVGTFTAQIGDPSDRESSRQPLTPTQIKKNMATYRKQASKILDFSKVKIKYNADWLAKLDFAELIKLASCFSVQQLLERDMFQNRLQAKKPIWLNEFMYPLMQGYDSVHMNVDLEVGGTDQTFNMLAGRTLQKIYRQKEKFVLTVPILEGTDGRKMSKTFDNYIALMDPPQEMFGKIMSLKDELIIRYFELCTDVPLSKIQAMKTQLQEKKVNPMELKKRLAREIVTLYHSQKKAEGADQEFAQVFQKGSLPSDLPVFPTKVKTWLLAQFLVKSGLASSKSEAKRLISQGGVDVNGETIDDLRKEVQFKDGDVIRVGKKRFIQVKIQS